jgi:hypothetical protein
VVLVTGGVLEQVRVLEDTAAIAAGARVHVHAFLAGCQPDDRTQLEILESLAALQEG